MIGKPTTPQLLATIKAELNDKIAPALTEPTLTVAVTMINSMLDALAIRAEHEMAWMRDECAAVEAAAARFDGADGMASVSAALAAYRGACSDSLHLTDVQADYDRATEVLSCLADAAYASESADAIRAVEQLIDQRLATELAVVGTFVAAGRE